MPLHCRIAVTLPLHCRYRQCYALNCLGNSLRNADMDMRSRTIMDETITKLCDDVGACERIFKTPVRGLLACLPRLHLLHLLHCWPGHASNSLLC